MFSVVPTKILYDNNITPQSKVVLLLLYEKVKTNKIHLDRANLVEGMKYTVGDKNILPTKEYIDQLLQELIDNEYIKRNNNTVTLLVETLKQETTKSTTTKKESPHTDTAKEVLEYLSESRIKRGFSKRPLTSKTFIDIIVDRLKEGASREECIKVINYAFIHDNWLSKNEKYLLPTTLFRKSNFAKYLASADAITNIERQIITPTGFIIWEEEGDEWVV